MYYLDDNMNILEANETTVYRVFGGDVSIDGRFISNEPPANPIQARMDLALSQHDFLDNEGLPIRNLASQIAIGTVFTDNEGRLINIETGELTDSVLEFKTVDGTSDMKGGGMEFNLEMDFEKMVEVEAVNELRHHSTDGWSDFVQVESLSMDEPQDSVLESWYEVSPYEESNDTHIYDDKWYEESHMQDSIDSLLDDEENIIQKNDVEDSWYDMEVEVGWVDPDEGMEENSRVGDGWYADTHEEDSIDLLIEDEIYENQKLNVNSFTEENSEWYTLQQNENHYKC